MTHRRFHRQLLRQGSLRGRRRGSTLLMVLALLSLLVLLASTMAFTSRIDVMSAQNFSRKVQSETAVLSTLGAASLSIANAIPADAVGPLDLVNLAHDDGQDGRGDQTWAAQTRRSDSAATRVSPLGRTDLTSARVEDASGRLNLNTADEAALRALFSQVASRHGVSVDAAGLAREIADWRLGPDGAPGIAGEDDNRSERFALATEPAPAAEEAPRRRARLARTCVSVTDDLTDALDQLRTGVDDPDEYVADIRRPAFGDDRRLQHVADLLEFDGVTPELVAALAPYVTTFSVSVPPLREDAAGHRTELVDLNRATAEQIFAALRAIYGDAKEDTLLRQFAVNVVDARDHDMIPTVMAAAANGTGVVIGFERTPVITEVYPDSRAMTPEDDGEYVEVYNPWSDALDLAGWSVAVNGQEFPLEGMLAPKAFLIVTDNYDQQRSGDKDLGLGSFYDVHGLVVAPPARRMAEFSNLDLPHGSGTHTVELRQRGSLVDRFDYSPGAQRISTHQSFQRRGDGLVRAVVVADATPYRLLPAESGTSTATAGNYPGPRDVEFLSVMELFDVFAGFAGKHGRDWAFPMLAAPASPHEDDRQMADDPGLLDARLVDAFTVEFAERPGVEEVSAEMERGTLSLPQRRLSAYAGDVELALDEDGRTVVEDEALEALAWERYLAAPIGMRHGLININTASEPVLVAAGFTPPQARMLAERRLRMVVGALEGVPSTGLLYANQSDLLGDSELWALVDGDSCGLRVAMDRVLSKTTVTSRAFLLEGQARSSASSEDRGKSSLKVRALVALDLPNPEIVTWSFDY